MVVRKDLAFCNVRIWSGHEGEAVAHHRGTTDFELGAELDATGRAGKQSESWGFDVCSTC